MIRFVSPSRSATRMAVAFALSFAAAPLVAQDSIASARRATADSSYTAAQAERGAAVFTRVCLECHERNEMANPDFKLKWGGQSTFDLWKNIATTMPDSDPGSLPRADYLDVVSYILKLNGVPAGSAELTADSASMAAAKLVLPAASSGGLALRSARGAVALGSARERGGVQRSFGHQGPHTTTR